MSKVLMIAATLVVLAVVAVAALFLHDMSRARARLAGQSQTIPTPYGRMEYAQKGQGDPVLVVHGAGGGFDQGLDMIGALADDGYRIVAPSRFGYLRSEMPVHATNAMQADAYAALLDHLGVHKAYVVAISAGAWSAVQFAIRHPDRCRALVLLVPANYLPPGTSMRGGAVVRAMFTYDFAAWAALKLMPVMPGQMTKMMLGTDPAVVAAADAGEKARVQQVLDHLLPVSARTAGMQLDIRSATVREPYALEKISCPVLAISAADDAFATFERAKFIVAGVPHGQLKIYPTGGHALVGDYKDVRREIVSFFAAAKP